MKRRIISLILAAVFVLSSAVLTASAEEEKVQDIVYNFLTGELGLCPAAAAGVMGNVQIECSFNPTALVVDTNDLYSFGLMMWNGPRYERLKSWCAENGYNHEDPRGQLWYLKWELENTEKESYAAILDIPNTIEGAVKAAIVWAEKFERCTRTSFGLRIYYALNLYWPDYAGGSVSNTPGIYGYYYNVPDNVKYGEPLTMYGAVVSYSSPLKSLTVGVFTENGTLVTGRTVDQSNLVGNIGVVDRFIVFNAVPKGSYYYTITAVNEAGDYIVDRHSFTVTDAPTSATLVKESEGGVICENGASCPGLAFSDMPPATSWKHSGIDYVLNAGLFEGKNGGVFAPDEEMNRAMFVTVVERLYVKYGLQFDAETEAESTEEPTESVETESASETAAEPSTEAPTESVTETESEPAESESTEMESTDSESAESEPSETESTDSESTAWESSDLKSEDLEATDPESDVDALAEEPEEQSFTDVPETAWYYDSVMWAYENGLTDGKGNGLFAPKASLTRAELATLFYRFAEKSGLDTSARGDLTGFADADKVRAWSEEALSWAVAEGLIEGSLSGGKLYLDPKGRATRAQVAAITERFAAYVENAVAA